VRTIEAIEAYPDAGTTPFRGEKGSPFEGGWRVPGLMWWPHHIPSDAKYGEMMSYIDAWSTLAAMHPSGYDAGKKIKGKKRQILVDTIELLLHAVIHPADIQDRDGGVLMLSSLFGMYPFLVKLFADAGYQGLQFQSAVTTAMPQLSIEMVKRSDQAWGSKCCRGAGL
jgi:hypothetical protein